MYLLTKDGIKKVPQKGFIRQLFCMHRNEIKGEDCSENGLVRISGCDSYLVCADCGKILAETHVNY